MYKYLMVVLKEKSRDHQSHQGSSPEAHESQSVQQVDAGVFKIDVVCVWFQRTKQRICKVSMNYPLGINWRECVQKMLCPIHSVAVEIFQSGPNRSDKSKWLTLPPQSHVASKVTALTNKLFLDRKTSCAAILQYMLNSLNIFRCVA